jgi:hypothetical protein
VMCRTSALTLLVVGEVLEFVLMDGCAVFERTAASLRTDLCPIPQGHPHSGAVTACLPIRSHLMRADKRLTCDYPSQVGAPGEKRPRYVDLLDWSLSCGFGVQRGSGGSSPGVINLRLGSAWGRDDVRSWPMSERCVVSVGGCPTVWHRLDVGRPLV